MLAHCHHCSLSTNSTAQTKALLLFCYLRIILQSFFQVLKDDGPDKRAECAHVGLER